MGRNGTTSTPSMGESDSATDKATQQEIAGAVWSDGQAKATGNRHWQFAATGRPYTFFRTQPDQIETIVDSGWASFRREGVRLECSGTAGDRVRLLGPRSNTHTAWGRRTLFGPFPNLPVSDTTLVGGRYSNGSGAYFDCTAEQYVVFDTNDNKLTKAASQSAINNAGIAQIEHDRRGDPSAGESHIVEFRLYDYDGTLLESARFEDSTNGLYRPGREIWWGESNGNSDNRTYFQGFVDEMLGLGNSGIPGATDL